MEELPKELGLERAEEAALQDIQDNNPDNNLDIRHHTSVLNLFIYLINNINLPPKTCLLTKSLSFPRLTLSLIGTGSALIVTVLISNAKIANVPLEYIFDAENLNDSTFNLITIVDE
jgi:hypothetical protein